MGESLLNLRRKDMFVAKQRITFSSHGIVKYYFLLSKTALTKGNTLSAQTERKCNPLNSLFRKKTPRAVKPKAANRAVKQVAKRTHKREIRPYNTKRQTNGSS